MLKFARIVLLVVAAPLMAAIAFDIVTYDAQAWRRDYDRLKRGLAQNYANLDWIVSHRRMNLKAIDTETAAALDGAYSNVRAALAMRDFVRRFQDPHLRVVWTNRWLSGASKARADAASRSPASCAEAGYAASDHAFRFPVDRLEGWKTLVGGHFPTGAAGEVGIVRVASFREEDYLAACEAVFRLGLSAHELVLAVRAKLREELIATLDAIKASGAKRLLVDVSGNGGGSEWVVDVTALLTDRELVRAAARQAAPTCDRMAIWSGETVCPALAPPGEPARLQGQGHWTGPVYILVDGSTASASEDFVAWLAQNGVARVIGERTKGAGCGYIDGGGRIELATAPFDVMAPNCARFLNDGTNELEGIAPDIEIPMTGDSARQKAALAAALNER